MIEQNIERIKLNEKKTQNNKHGNTKLKHTHRLDRKLNEINEWVSKWATEWMREWVCAFVCAQ